MLEADYAHLAADQAQLHAQLAPLAKLHGNATIARWKEWAQSRRDGRSSPRICSTRITTRRTSARSAAISRAIANAAVLRVDDTRDATFRAPRARSCSTRTPRPPRAA